MKRRLMLVFVLLFASLPFPGSQSTRAQAQEVRLRLLSSTNSEILLELQVPSYQVNPLKVSGEDFSVVTVDGAVSWGAPGAPELPAVTALLAAPPHGTFSVELLDSNFIEIQEKLRLAPVPSPAALDSELSAGQMERQVDAAAYARSAWLPEQPVFVEEAWLRNQRILSLRLHPFQYQPAAQTLRRTQKLVVAIRFSDAGEQIPSSQPDLEQTDPFESILRPAVLNPDKLKTWRFNPNQDTSQTNTADALSAASRYRIAIQQDGLYRLSYDQLQAAGLPVSGIDPASFRLTSQGADVALYVHNLDGQPGVFSQGEYLAFYGQKFRGDRLAARFSAENLHWSTYWREFPDGSSSLWKPEMNAEMFEKYTDTNVYWLSYGGIPGARMALESGIPAGAAVPVHYPATATVEQDIYWRTQHFATEETFYWDYFSVAVPTARFYAIGLSALAGGVFTATVEGQIVAQAKNDFAGPDHHMRVYINDAALTAPVLDTTWEGRSVYNFQASFPQSRLISGNNRLDIQVLPTSAVPTDYLLINWFQMHYRRLFQSTSDSLTFEMDQAGPWRYQVTNYTTADLGVLEISSAFTPTWITGATFASGTLSFQVNHPAGRRYYAGKFTEINAAQIVLDTPPDLSAPADYVIITHNDFLSAVQPLANFRQAQGLETLVVDIQDLFDQFTDGIYHPLAIKEFLRYTFANWSRPPTYIFLVGDGTWNLKNSPFYNNPKIYIPPLLGWIDPWQGEMESSSLLANVVGDDILPDVMIGRLTANSTAEITSYIDKVTAYETMPLRSWQQNLMFIADNVPDPTGDFVYSSEQVIADYVRPGYTAQRVFENDFDCPFGVPGNLQPCPVVNQVITSTWNTTGSLLASYVGHGAINRWSSEAAFLNQNIPTLNNAAQLPVILSMDCLDGYWLHPGIIGTPVLHSLIEEMVRADGRGAIAAFSPTGFGVATGHDSLQRGFLDSLLLAGDWRLGAAAQSAKLRLYLTGSHFDLINTYTVFGDPALRILSSHAMSVSPTSASLAAPAGWSVTYGLQVFNTGSITDTYTISLGSSAWTTTAPSVTQPVAPGESAIVNVMVEIPSGVPDGSQDTVVVKVRSSGDNILQASVTLTTLAQVYYMTWQPSAMQLNGSPGATVTYNLELINNGANTDTYDLSLSGQTWLTQLVTPTPVVNVLPGAKRSVQVTVRVPANVVGGSFDQVVLTAQSRGNTQVKALATLTTNTDHRIYLPEVER